MHDLAVPIQTFGMSSHAYRDFKLLFSFFLLLIGMVESHVGTRLNWQNALGILIGCNIHKISLVKI